MADILLPFKWIARVVGNAAYKFYWDDCFSRASSLAYTTLFALVPISALTFALFKGFAVAEGQAYLESILEQVLPSANIERTSRGEAYSDVVQFLDTRAEELGATFDPSLLREKVRSLLSGESGGLNAPLSIKESEEIQNLLLGSLANAYRAEGKAFDRTALSEELSLMLLVEDNLLDTLKQQVFNVLKELGNNVRDAGVVTLGVLLFIGIALLNTIESALNAVWRVTSDQSVISKIISFWAVISLGPLLIAISFYWYSQFGQVTEGELLFGSNLLPILNFLVPIGAIWLALTLMLYKLPAASVQLKDAAFGAIVAAVGFELMKRAFAYYISVSTTYSTFYGVLVTIPLFLFWLYCVWCVVLFGAEISYLSGSIKVLTSLRKYASDLGEIGAVLGLRILYSIGCRFLRGERPPTESEIAVETGSDPVLVRSCLEILAEAGLITSSDARGHTRSLLLTPDKIKVQDVVEAFHSKTHLRHLKDEKRESEGREMDFVRAVKNASFSTDPTVSVNEWTLSDFLRAQGMMTEQDS